MPTLKKRILIVDDDEALSNLVTEILQIEGYETDWCLDAPSTLAYLQEQTPDLILLDLHLPKVSGKEILTNIKADERLVHTKVAMLTADQYGAYEMELDADTIHAKPVSYDQLTKLCRQLLN